jgi:demethylmenaquinone methyltransferase/2-methoxy-6-polyprenyl-1,4-benzoquinol methylase
MFDHFDWVAFAYDRVLGKPDVERFRRLLRLPAQGWILDAGGGTGRVSAHLRTWAGGVVVSDLSRGMLRQALGKKVVSPVRAHAERLPFRDSVFDRVLVVDALHHFCDQGQSIADLLRVLKPGGRLLIEEPDLGLPVVRAVALLEKLFLMQSRFETPEAIRDRIAAHGLAAAVERGGGFRAWVWADKP